MLRLLVALVLLLAACAQAPTETPGPGLPDAPPGMAETAAGDCAEGWTPYVTQLGPKCIRQYDERLIRSWPQCSRATQCRNERCVFAPRTPGGETIEWDPMGEQERPSAGFRCVPDEYYEMLLHSSGATLLDEDGEEATVIA